EPAPAPAKAGRRSSPAECCLSEPRTLPPHPPWRKPAPRCSQSARSQQSTLSAMTCTDTPLQHLTSGSAESSLPGGPAQMAPIPKSHSKVTLSSFATAFQSNIEVHAELIRMRADADRIDLVFSLVFDPVVDHVGGKNVAL